MINETEKVILKRLDRIELKLDKLIRRKNRSTLKDTNELKTRILKRITARWETKQMPVDLVELSRHYARQFKDMKRSAEEVLLTMPEIICLEKYTNAKTYLTIKTEMSLTSDERHRVKAFNLSEKTMRRFKQIRAITDAPSEFESEEFAKFQAEYDKAEKARKEREALVTNPNGEIKS